MLKKNKHYKDIAAAYMKTIKPRKPKTTKSSVESVSSHPLSNIPEEKRTLKVVSKAKIETTQDEEKATWPSFMQKMKSNSSIPNILKNARSEQHEESLEKAGMFNSLTSF